MSPRDNLGRIVDVSTDGTTDTYRVSDPSSGQEFTIQVPTGKDPAGVYESINAMAGEILPPRPEELLVIETRKLEELRDQVVAQQAVVAKAQAAVAATPVDPGPIDPNPVDPVPADPIIAADVKAEVK